MLEREAFAIARGIVSFEHFDRILSCRRGRAILTIVGNHDTAIARFQARHDVAKRAGQPVLLIVSRHQDCQSVWCGIDFRAISSADYKPPGMPPQTAPIMETRRLSATIPSKICTSSSMALLSEKWHERLAPRSGLGLDLP